MSEKVKVTIVGSGYVGMSLAVLRWLSTTMLLCSISFRSVSKKLTSPESTVANADIETFLKKRELSLSATLDVDEAYPGADFVVVATPTNYDPDTNRSTRWPWTPSLCKLRHWPRTR